ncbi:MAG: hypothetical protein WBZ36_10805 [Candidatus Nitrosopolaris sp.]
MTLQVLVRKFMIIGRVLEIKPSKKSTHAYNIITAALITVVHEPSLCPSADSVKLCVL